MDQFRRRYTISGHSTGLFRSQTVPISSFEIKFNRSTGEILELRYLIGCFETARFKLSVIIRVSLLVFEAFCVRSNRNQLMDHHMCHALVVF